MNKISFGVRVPNSGPLDIENIVNAAKSAEELGFDAIWVHDHVVWAARCTAITSLPVPSKRSPITGG